MNTVRTARALHTHMENSKRDQEVAWAIFTCVPFVGPACGVLKACAEGDLKEAAVQSASLALDCATAGTGSTALKASAKSAKLLKESEKAVQASKLLAESAKLAKEAELASHAAKGLFGTDLMVKSGNAMSK